MTSLPGHTTDSVSAEPRFDRARAAKVMDDLGLDAVILGNPVNIFHATSYRNAMVTAQSPHGGTAMALVTRDERLPIALVMGSSSYSAHADIHRDSECEIYQVSDPTDGSSLVMTGGTPLAGVGFILPDRQQAPLTPLEKNRAEAVQKWADRHPVGISRKAALGRALKDLGLERARIGLDAAGPYDILADIAPAVTVADATDVMTRLRLVKSPFEIKLMRRAARANAEAALAAVQVVRAGGSYNDLRRAFFTETSKRGGIPTWMIVDRAISDAYEATFRDGQAFYIDAVSSTSGYHGDYGRTVFVGEPTKAMTAATHAIVTAWNAIREKLRPGLRFSDIRALGQDTLRKMGSDTAVRFTTHSVGLYHTDATGLGDIVLEKGMTISVDCPVMDTGIGGSAHLEDLTLITAGGSETLNDTGHQTIVV